MENLYNWMDNLCLKVENIVVKGEIARFEQFLLLSLCFQKAVCCNILNGSLVTLRRFLCHLPKPPVLFILPVYQSLWYDRNPEHQREVVVFSACLLSNSAIQLSGEQSIEWTNLLQILKIWLGRSRTLVSRSQDGRSKHYTKETDLDASAADDVWRHCVKGKKAHNELFPFL